MEVKSTEWRPGPTVCRCCLSEGCYKDISTEYFWMGKREVYAEMLSETFDVTIGFSKSGGPNSNSRLICEPCISRLRDASEFKRQVLECEKTFMQHLDPGTSTSADLDITVDMDKEVKLERVKTEKRLSDDDFDDRVGFDDDDDDDDLDDEPLTKLASKVPKKESVDLLDLLDNAKVAEKRKSTAKTKSTPAKKSKKETIQPTPSKSVKIEKKKKAGRYDPTRSNAATILKYTTAHPFRVNDKCILCAYCHDMYEDPDEFRQHMDQEHATFNVNVAFHNLPKTEFIKVDVADLRCRICTRRFDELNTIADHLKMEHKQKIDWDGKLGVMPYLLQRDVFNCAVCKKNFPSLFHLNRHTITHFLSYVCHVCGSSYIATTGLLRHVRSKHQDYEVVCKNCRKVFPTMKAKERHRRTEKSCMPYCCTKCPERFLDFRTRQKHLETAHGYSKRTYRCGDCDTNFANELAYYEHFKLHHSKDCAVCKHCGLKFISANRLKRHMVKHTF